MAEDKQPFLLGSWIHLVLSCWLFWVHFSKPETNGGSPGTTKSGFLSTVPEEICFAESRSMRNQWWQQEKSGHFSAHISQISVLTTSHDVWGMKNQRLGDSMISGCWENTNIQKKQPYNWNSHKKTKNKLYEQCETNHYLPSWRKILTK